MPSFVTRGNTEHVLCVMGLKILKKNDRFTVFGGDRVFVLSFKGAAILWDDLVHVLDYEGVNRDVFIAELDSL